MVQHFGWGIKVGVLHVGDSTKAQGGLEREQQGRKREEKKGRDRGYNPDQDMNAKWPEAWDLVSGTAIKSERLVP